MFSNLAGWHLIILLSVAAVVVVAVIIVLALVARRPSKTNGHAEALRRLTAMHAEGLITDSEYAAKRAEILNRM